MIFFAQEALPPESEESMFTEICGQFGIELGPFLMQCVSFAILASVVWYFGLRPVLKVVDERQKKIADGLQFSEEMKVKLAAAESDYQKKIAEASVAASELLEQARRTAKQTIEQATQDAIVKAEEIAKRAAENNAREREKMLAELKSEVAGLVVEATTKLLSRDATDAEKSRMLAAAAQAIQSEDK
ncbi:MAG: F0F1 ATP synthase subunit B [Opitutales bacterium]|nr:F0F1 ATP synthase subunit B [Opitutales bacterium]